MHLKRDRAMLADDVEDNTVRSHQDVINRNHTPCVQELDLSSNGISSIQAISDLAFQLTQLPHLRALRASNNPLGSDGFAALIEQLQACSALREVHLDGVTVGDEALVALRKYLQRPQNALTQLSLAHAHFSQLGLAVLLHKLRLPTTLMRLNLDAACMTQSSVRRLAAACANCHRLAHVSLQGAKHSRTSDIFAGEPCSQHFAASLRELRLAGPGARSTGVADNTVPWLALSQLALSEAVAEQLTYLDVSDHSFATSEIACGNAGFTVVRSQPAAQLRCTSSSMSAALTCAHATPWLHGCP